MTRFGRSLDVLVFISVTGFGCAVTGGSNADGDELRSKGDLSGAYQAYRKDVQKDPQSVDAQTSLGEVLVDMKRYDEAAVALEKARELGATDRASVALATARAGLGLYDEASAMMDEALQRSPTADNYYRAAQIKLAQKKPRDAMPLLEASLKADNKRLETQGAVGRAQSQLGEHEAAIKTLEAVLKVYKKQGAAAADMEVALAQSLIAQGRIEDAFRAYRRAAGLDARNPEAHAGYASMLRERGDIEGAISVLKTAESKTPKAAIVQYQLGLAYRDFKLRDQALAALRKAVQLDPGFADAYPPLIAMMDEDKVPTDKLYNTLEAAAARAPEDFDMQMRFGKLAQSKRQYVKAITAFERAVGARPSDVEANFSLGQCQVASGKLEEAKQSFDALRVLDEPKAAELAALIEAAPPPQTSRQAQADSAKDSGGKKPTKAKPAPKKPSKGKKRR